ncbi:MULTISPECIES: TonB-dependent receptor [unclassified Janthinobacterium]|uniref:TonB-dependent receptor domain-containing protein n=1 Tax=unclassified Janthinobacterium TaxID=2610881 RepID=UPI001E317309|nr:MULTISPECIES: TonB-dependent receptor [unclassified Janthinobacterium]MCC7642280.1 TonB-dependent receptor [Janthinobacterium sp. EB271-G4-3-1]MCC7692307.1 TonB-dependent receptor [Janthinobacterium sp. EB271-G4-3-2]
MRHAVPLFLLGASALPIAPLSFAQQTADTPAEQAAPLATLPEVKLIGQSAPDAPLPGITRISRETLQRQQAMDVADVFASEPAVSIGGGASNAQRIYLRGVDGANLHISIDGARQGRSLHQHRGDLGGIDPDLLKQVDIQPGPSADAGPGALGGSIRFNTVDAQDLLAPGKRSGATVRAAYASADEARRGAVSAYGMLGDAVGLLAHVSAVNRDNYRIGGGGDVPNSAGHDRDYLLKLSLLDLAGHSLRLGAARNRNAGLYLFSRVGSDNGYAPANAVPTSQRSERHTYTLEHRYQPAGNALLDWKFNLYLNKNALEDVTQARGARTTERGGSARNTAQLALAGTQHRLTAGADFMDEEGVTDGVLGAAILGPGRKSTQARNLGLFVQERMRWQALQLSLGVRHDHYHTAFGPRTVKGGKTSPNAGAELELGGGVGAFASYGEAVRASGIIPIGFLTSLDKKSNFNNGKPFKPETSATREAGLQYEGANALQDGDHLTVRLGYFDTRIANLIEWAGQGVVYPAYIRNMPETLRSRGWEWKARWQRGGYGTSVGVVLADTTVGGKPLNPARRVGTALGDRLTWDSQWQVLPGLTAGYTLNAVRRLDDVPKAAVRRAGYVLHDVQLQWQPAALRALSLALTVRNLGDKRYTSHSSLDGGTGNILPEPGRDVRVSANYQF